MTLDTAHDSAHDSVMTDSLAPICESCSFGPGVRTGAVRTVRLLSCLGDWHTGDVHALCDDCLSTVDASTWEEIDVERMARCPDCGRSDACSC